MAKNKERKKKERERRVAQKKRAAALQRAREKTTQEAKNTLSNTKKTFTVATPSKTQYDPIDKKSPFTQQHGND